MAKDKMVNWADGSAFNELFKQTLETDIPITVGTFDDFVQNIYARSFPNCNMNTWHIRYMAGKVDKLLENPNGNRKLLCVLPRFHLKSTILGHAASIYMMLRSYGDGMYISYKDDAASYHTRHIKKEIADNPILSPFMKDLHPLSDSNLGYKIGNKTMQIYTSGITSFKRGFHTDSILCCDDILGDLTNPMVLDELKKTEQIFNAEISQIPNKQCLFIVVGTVIDYSDLLFKLKGNPEWETIWMPALNPDDQHEVLWEAMFPKEELEKRKESIGWKAFSTEFLLTPFLATESFFTKEELDPLIAKVKNYSIYQPFNKRPNEKVVAGFDVGKRRHPSHLAVFVGDETEHLTMIHQSFWDNVDYEEQVKRLTMAVENFGIDKMYIDNTRSEMEDRGLPRQCIPIKFTGRGVRNQASFAIDFAKKVERREITLIDDDRFISQILCVNNDLKAPDTAAGHGDAFYSVALAIGAWQDFYAKNTGKNSALLGNVQSMVGAESPSDNTLSFKFKGNSKVCPFCGDNGIEYKEDSKSKYCSNCNTIF